MPKRRAMTLIELLVSLVILGVATVGVVQLLATAGAQRRLAGQRQLALAEVANYAEQLALIPFERTAKDTLPDWRIEPASAEALPGLSPQIEVMDDGDGDNPRARRIRLSLAWQVRGQAVDPVSLTIWKFAPEEQP